MKGAMRVAPLLRCFLDAHDWPTGGLCREKMTISGPQQAALAKIRVIPMLQAN
jgi:hypothetical protein